MIYVYHRSQLSSFFLPVFHLLFTFLQLISQVRNSLALSCFSGHSLLHVQDYPPSALLNLTHSPVLHSSHSTYIVCVGLITTLPVTSRFSGLLRIANKVQIRLQAIYSGSNSDVVRRTPCLVLLHQLVPPRLVASLTRLLLTLYFFL